MMNDKEDTDVRQLLSKVSLIRKKYDEIATLTGENFNIFRILRLSTYEVRTHSAFIAELLSPKGCHGQKDTFLKLFVSQLGLDFNTVNVTVSTEKHAGLIDKDYTQGGYIDILIANERSAIVIENKIYAGLQHNQLERYANFVEKRYSNATILYLTLDGNDVDKECIAKINTGKTKLIKLSYKDDIKNWLNLCLKEVSTLPILRESIIQYINLIKHLTHQSINKIQEMEINKQLLSSEDTFESAKLISAAVTNIKDSVYQCVIELEKEWKRIYDSKEKEVELFTLEGYSFMVRPSYEDNYFHFELFPTKTGKLGFADKEEFAFIRHIAFLFENRSQEWFGSNPNYTAWVKIKRDFCVPTYQDYKIMVEDEDRASWLTEAVKEGRQFVTYILKEVSKIKEDRKIDNLEIKVDDNLVNHLAGHDV